MDEQEVIEKLTEGWELRNFGKGWWLRVPHKPYARSEAVRIPDAVVDALEKAGRIEIEMKTTSLEVKLK